MVNTQKLRELARAARVFSGMPGNLPPFTVKAHINGLSDCVESACSEIDAHAAEIECLRTALAELANAVGGKSPGDEPNVYADYDELHRLLSQARAALSGEPT